MPALAGREDTPRLLFVDGKWTSATDGSELEVLDPATGQAFTSSSNAGAADAIDAVNAAAAAAEHWAGTSPRARSSILLRAYELMLQRRDAIATLIVRENGKAFEDALGEVTYAAEFFRWYAEETVRIGGDLRTAPSGTNRILVTHQPIGVAVLVTPWNFPAAMATRKIAPALAVGCTVVLKPAPETPMTALLLAELLAEAGVPDGVVNVLPSDRSAEVVSTLLEQPAVRKLSFTGSTEVGRVLLAQAARRVLSCSMELGGNAPFLVLANADLQAAVAGAMVAKMRNGGEACTAANRFYVHESVASEFADMLSVEMSRLRVGAGLDEGVQLGPLVNAEAVDKVERLVTDAVARGATVDTGGRRLDRPGFFYEPTVLSNVANDSDVLREEIFGPVAPIVPFADIHDAVGAANDSEFGLVAYVYTTDLAEGLRVSEALDSGMVGLNRGVVSDPAAPFGGVKQSGLGREGGQEGLLEYTETKYIATSW